MVSIFKSRTDFLKIVFNNRYYLESSFFGGGGGGGGGFDGFGGGFLAGVEQEGSGE